MSRSIFQRLLFTYLTIIILVIVVLAALLTQFFNHFYFYQKQQELLAAGKEASARVLDYDAARITRTELDQVVNSISTVSGTRIFIYQGEHTQKLLEAEGGSAAGESELLSDTRKILQGETVIRKKHFSPRLNTYVVFVGMPVRDGDDVTGMVLLFSPVDQVNRTLYRVYRIIWSTAVFASLAGGVVIYLTSRRISRPVVAMKEAAAALAAGDFSREIQATGTDEIGQLAASFEYMRNKLQDIEQLRREFLANISHELRTPLTSIKGFIQAILDGVIPQQEQKKYLQLASSESDRLTRLVCDLLELGRLQAGGIKLQYQPVNLLEVAQEVAASFRLLAGKREITVDPLPEDPLIVPGDRDRIRQVLLNLLSNAVQYTDETGTIQILLHRESGQAVLTVQDNGKGIPKGELEKIFDKFHRVDRSRDTGTGGTGLGLAIVKELVELHKGQVFARSTGQGTAIVVKLPVWKQ